MSVLQTFRHYTICQDRQGATVEVWRDADEVACLAFDNRQHHFVELRVAVGTAERGREAANFISVVQLASPLRHRNLLGVIEGGEDEGANFYISEFLDGERLDSWLARCHPLPPWLALLIIRQLVEGLAALVSHPQLLAGVEVFHAGLTLSGARPDDLTVKICDLGLSRGRPVSTEPQFVEARAIHETGRLLLYMLTGSMAGEPAAAASLQGQNPAPELTFLLNTIFQATQPHHPRTLEQLRTLTERCAHDLSPELTALPEVFPPALRPRLPLVPHFPEGREIADPLSNDFTIDIRPPDAADPYRFRGTERTTRRGVNVQIYPPAHLLPPEFLLPSLELAASASRSNRRTSLLTPVSFHPEGPVPVMVEELQGRISLATIHRLRAPMEPEEVQLILSRIEAAAGEAGALELPLFWRSPRLVSVEFTEPGGEQNLPPPGELARLPLTRWPSFVFKIRTWPTALDFTQPGRFQLERLLARDPAISGESGTRPGPAAAGALPSARDYALLALWLLGGSRHLKDNLKSLLYSAISGRRAAAPDRQEFLQRFLQRITLSPPVRPKPPEKPLRKHGGKGKNRGPQGAGKTQPTAAPVPPLEAGDAGEKPSPSKEEPQEPPAVVPAASRDRHGPLPEPEAARGAEPDNESEEEEPALGFAEALFGAGAGDPAPAPASRGRKETSGWGAMDAHEEAEVTPHPWRAEEPAGGLPGFMEAAGQTGDWEPGEPIDFHDHEGRRATNRWMLLVTVILIAAGIAALMAHFSGQAIWLK